MRTLSFLIYSLIVIVSIEKLSANDFQQNLLFPLPGSLKPNVSFWIKVYSKYNDDQIIIHDSKNLNIIYEVIDLKNIFLGRNISKKKKWEKVNKIKEKYQKLLTNLAQKNNINPKTLNESERYVYELFSPDQTPAIFSVARSRIRAQQGQRNRFERGLIRSGKYMPLMIKIFKQYNLPLELTVLPHVESSFYVRAYSKFGAAGLWQFTRGTGRLFLTINYNVDERFDPEKSTEAAAKLLKKNYEELGTWPLAINAYNHGVNGIKRAIRALSTTDIGVITQKYTSRRYRFASRNFYSEFLAALHVAKNYKKYFGELEFDKPEKYSVIELPYYTRLSTLIKQLNSSVEEIKSLNPSLRRSVLESRRRLPKGFRLRIPWRQDFDDDQFYAQIPKKEKLNQQIESEWYRVKRGDNLKKIARRFNTTVEDLLALNDDIVDSHRIYVNQIIRVDSHEAKVSKAQTKLASAENNEKIAKNIKWYQVRKGDNLDQIAKKFDISTENLMAINNITNKNQISIGQFLLLKADTQVNIDSTATSTKLIADAAKLSARKNTEIIPKNYEQKATPPLIPEENKLANHWYEVKLGDNLEKIAQKYGVSVRQLIETNHIENKNHIVEGQTLIIPSTADSVDKDVGTQKSLLLSEFARNDLSDADRSPPYAQNKVSNKINNNLPANKMSSSITDEIYVLPEETLGHFADWLEMPTQKLRQLNGLYFGQEIQLNQKIKIIYVNVRKQEFKQRRMEYHRSIEEDFFASFHIDGVQIHKLRYGENIWYLCNQIYEVPYWLLIKYNPNINLNRLNKGDEIIIPIIKQIRS